MIIKKYFIPNLISLSNILCGFIAIVMASYNEIKFASYMILLGAIFDGLDGKVARALKVTDNMGKEIDSLADLATFGLAGGYLLYQGSLYQFGNIGMLISAFVPMCAAIRLARFNVKPTKRFFIGLPSTWAGLSIAILIGFYQNKFTSKFFLIFAISISLLMVSKFKYYNPNKSFFKLTPKKILLFSAIIAVFIINFSIALLLFVFWYIASGIILTIFKTKSPESSESFKINY